MLTKVTIVDVQIPFLSIIILIVKWGFAFIPASFFLFVVCSLVGSFLGVSALGLIKTLAR